MRYVSERMHIPAASEDGFYTEAGTSPDPDKQRHFNTEAGISPDPGKKKAVLKSTAKKTIFKQAS